jgi:hypothetical protein
MKRFLFYFFPFLLNGRGGDVPLIIIICKTQAVLSLTNAFISHSTVDQLLRKREVHLEIHRRDGARCQSGDYNFSQEMLLSYFLFEADSIDV